MMANNIKTMSVPSADLPSVADDDNDGDKDPWLSWSHVPTVENHSWSRCHRIGVPLHVEDGSSSSSSNNSSSSSSSQTVLLPTHLDWTLSSFDFEQRVCHGVAIWTVAPPTATTASSATAKPRTMASSIFSHTICFDIGSASCMSISDVWDVTTTTTTVPEHHDHHANQLRFRIYDPTTQKGNIQQAASPSPPLLDLSQCPFLGRALEIALPENLHDDKTKTTTTVDSICGGCSFRIAIAYSTLPAATALHWLTAMMTAEKRYPALFTSSFAIHARTWLPCLDRPDIKFTWKATVTVPTWATCVMAGLLVHDPRTTTTATTRAGDADDDANDCVVDDATTTKAAISTTSNTITKTHHTWIWEQTVPVPSYLVAMAIGELAYYSREEDNDVDGDNEQSNCRHRCCGVWAEPCQLRAAVVEFAAMRSFWDAAQLIAGHDYVWNDRLDLLVLPPSCPMGGMENPNVIFVTPTLLAGGDGSLATVVAHEIAHAWTGNWVTCSSWNDFWLNEGWTRWLERRIMTRVLQDGGQYAATDAVISYQSMQQQVQDASTIPIPFTQLVLDLTPQTDPDSAYSLVPYEKGSALLQALERRVGSTRFEQFFQAYLWYFAIEQHGTVSSEQFRQFTMQYFSISPSLAHLQDHDPQQQHPLHDVDWQAWYYQPGMPTEDPGWETSTQLIQAAQELARAWYRWDRQNCGEQQQELGPPPPPPPPPHINISSWSALQTMHFLDTLQQLASKDSTRGATTEKEEMIPNETSAGSVGLQFPTWTALDDCYRFATSSNCEILFRYCLLGITAVAGATVMDVQSKTTLQLQYKQQQYQAVLAVVGPFLASQGRLKFVRPLYRALYQTAPDDDMVVAAAAAGCGGSNMTESPFRVAALELFEQCRSSYHPMCAKLIAADLHLK